MVGYNIKQAFRSLRKRRLYSVLGIGGFAVGLSVFMCMALFVDREYRMDREYPNYERMFRLVDTGAEGKTADLDYDLYPILQEKYPEVELVCPVRQKVKWPFLFQTKTEYIETESFLSTTNEFFDLFSIPILKSSAAEPLPDDNSVVITESTAHKLFGDNDPIGQTVILSGSIPLTVTALIADLPDKSSFTGGFILNAHKVRFRFGRAEKNGKMINPINQFILLREGTDVDAFTRKLNNTLKDYSPSVTSVALQPVSSIYLTSGIEGNYNKSGSPALIYVFMAIGGLILCLSLINYVHFVLAGQRASQKTTGIKRVHGAGLRHLLEYYFTESVLSLGMALALALGLVGLTLPFAGSLFEGSLEFSDLFSGRLVAVLCGTVLLVVALVSLVSVWATRRIEIHSLGKPQQTSHRRFGKAFLTVFQLSVSIALIACVIGIHNQLGMIRTSSLGFQSDHLVRLNPPPTFQAQEALKKRLMESSFVEDCAWSNGSPGYISYEFLGGSEGSRFEVHGIGGEIDLLKTMGIELLEGRDFLPSDAEKACVVNQAALKKMGYNHLDEMEPGSDNGLPYQIVGVVNDFHIASFRSVIEPICVFFTQEEPFFLNVRLQPGNVPDQMRQIGEIWGTLLPDSPFNYSFYDAYFDSLYRTEERQGKAISAFSFIALLITAMGLLGQVFHQCLSRTKEIGVRKVNGAKVSEVLLLLNRDFVTWVVIAFVVATPLAWYAMHRWLEAFAYKTPLSWWIFALAGVLALSIALLTVSWQSWKAATRNPVESLRYE